MDLTRLAVFLIFSWSTMVLLCVVTPGVYAYTVDFTAAPK